MDNAWSQVCSLLLWTVLFLGARIVLLYQGLDSRTINWLRVLDTAEGSQVDQRVGHQLHTVMPLLDTFKAEQQLFEFIFPRKGALDAHAPCMDRGIEEPLAAALGTLVIPGILWDVGDQARIENVRAITCGIKATIEVEIRASEVQAHLFGRAFQRFQTLREQGHIRCIDWRDREGSQDIAMILRDGR
jgi:hypothetical protein